MYITNITNDYNDTLSIINNCTNNDNNIEIIMFLFTIIPCGMSHMFNISDGIYSNQTFIQQKINYYKWRSFFTQGILLCV